MQAGAARVAAPARAGGRAGATRRLPPGLVQFLCRGKRTTSLVPARPAARLRSTLEFEQKSCRVNSDLSCTDVAVCGVLVLLRYLRHAKKYTAHRDLSYANELKR